jgi:hypothetical protein
MEEYRNDLYNKFIICYNLGCLPELYRDGINYEEYFKLYNLNTILNQFTNFNIQKEYIYGLYLYYNINKLTDEDKEILKGYDYNELINKIKAKKDNFNKFTTDMNQTMNNLNQIKPLDYNLQPTFLINTYSFYRKDGKEIDENDSLLYFNKLSTTQRFPIILYVNSQFKKIYKLPTNYSFSFNKDKVLNGEYERNSLIFFDELANSVIFNFKSKIVSIKQKGEITIGRISQLFNDLEFKQEMNNTKVYGSISFYFNEIKDIKDIYTFFLTNDIASKLFYIKENKKPWFINDKNLYIYFRDFCNELFYQDIKSPTLRFSVNEKNENKKTGFTIKYSAKKKDNNIVDSFIYITSRLLKIMLNKNTSDNNIKKYNAAVFTKPLTKLKTVAPELFTVEKKVKGEKSKVENGQRYCRKCESDQQPLIIEKDEIEYWIRYGRQPYEYKTNNNTYWFVCPLQEYPHINLIDVEIDNLGNSIELPCCSKTDIKNVKKDIKTIKSTSRINSTESQLDSIFTRIKINDDLNDFLKKSLSDDYESYEFTKMGTFNNEVSILNSFITAILISLGKVIDGMSTDMLNREINNIRILMSELPMDIYKQELYDVPDDVIKSNILNKNTFIDPYLYYRGLEIIFNIQIFVFTSYKGRKNPLSIEESNLNLPTLEIPRCKYMHIRNQNKNPIVCIYKNYGISNQNLKTIPSCELICFNQINKYNNINKKVNNDNDKFSNSIFNLLKSSCLPLEWYKTKNRNIEETCILDPYDFNWLEFDFGELGRITGQKIDSYGKTTTLYFREWELRIPPTQPLYLKKNVKNVIVKNREDAYKLFEYQSEDNEGIWVKFNGIDKGIKVICSNENSIKNITLMKSYDLINKKNKASILLQVINWLWRSEWNHELKRFPVFIDWWSENRVIDDDEIFEFIPDPLINFNNLMLPMCDNFNDRIKFIASKWPFFFYSNKIHVNKSLNRKIENFFHMEDIRSRDLTPNDIYGEINRFIVGLIPTENDYKKSNDIILTKKEDIEDWFNKYNSEIYKYNSLHNVNIIENVIYENFYLKKEPFFYRNKYGKIYLVQNCINDSLTSSLHVCRYWYLNRINPGNNYINTTDSGYNINELNYVIYINQSDNLYIYVDNTNNLDNYYEVFKYNNNIYAAMLPLL